jgi:hypothetical protein
MLVDRYLASHQRHPCHKQVRQAGSKVIEAPKKLTLRLIPGTKMTAALDAGTTPRRKDDRQRGHGLCIAGRQSIISVNLDYDESSGVRPR